MIHKKPIFLRRILFPIAVALAMFSSGCAFVPQQATLAPQVAVTGSDIGNGAEVALRVTDERPTQELGRRGTAYGPAAAITTDQDMEELIFEALSDGLQQNGFFVSPYNGTGERILLVELRHLEYSTSTGFWSGGIHMNGAIKATGQTNGHHYDQFYRVGDEQRSVVVPAAGQNEQMINESLSQLIGSVLHDEDLLRFLAN